MITYSVAILSAALSFLCVVKAVEILWRMKQ